MPFSRLFNRILKAELLDFYDRMIREMEETDWNERFERHYQRYKQYEEGFWEGYYDKDSSQSQQQGGQYDRSKSYSYSKSGYSKQEHTYYQVLEVEPGASFEEIRKSYRSLQKKYHPDRFNNDMEKRQLAERVSAKLNEAYSYFSEKQKGK